MGQSGIRHLRHDRLRPVFGKGVWVRFRPAPLGVRLGAGRRCLLRPVHVEFRLSPDQLGHPAGGYSRQCFLHSQQRLEFLRQSVTWMALNIMKMAN